MQGIGTAVRRNVEVSQRLFFEVLQGGLASILLLGCTAGLILKQREDEKAKQSNTR